MKELQVLVLTELRAGLSLAEMALRSKDLNVIQRYTAMARQAYDSILRLSLRMKLSEPPLPEFDKDLKGLRVILRQLGEKL